MKNETTPVVNITNSTKTQANITKAPTPAVKAAPKKVVKADPETEGMSPEEKEVYDMNKKLKASKQKSLDKNSEGAMGSHQKDLAKSKSAKVDEQE